MSSTARPDLASASAAARAAMDEARGRIERLCRLADLFLASTATRPHSAPHLSPRLVLAVDDEPAILSAIRRVLERELPGVVVLTAGSLDAARTLLGMRAPTASSLPSVVLLDMHLGEELGWELAAALPDAMRVILMSGMVDDAKLQALAAKLGARWLAKPFELDALVALVREELEAAARAQPRLP